MGLKPRHCTHLNQSQNIQYKIFSEHTCTHMLTIHRLWRHLKKKKNSFFIILKVADSELFPYGNLRSRSELFSMFVNYLLRNNYCSKDITDMCCSKMQLFVSVSLTLIFKISLYCLNQDIYKIVILYIFISLCPTSEYTMQI